MNLFFKYKLYVCLILFLLISTCIDAQISEKSKPISFENQLPEAPVVEMPSFDLKQILKEESDRKKGNKLKPFQFAKTFEVNLSYKNSGIWDSLRNGRLWRLTIASKSAWSLNIIFSNYRLPKGAKLFLYNNTNGIIQGAFTEKNNSNDGILATSPIAGDEITIEYFEPYKCDFIGSFVIKQVAHDYKNVFSYLSSGSCNVDINCEQGTDWQIEKRSVVKIMVNGSSICTGTLINNTSYNKTPYILTANHCVSTQEKASRLVFVFNYENTVCGTFDATNIHSISGSILRSTPEPGDLDFALLELSSMPPSSYKPYFAGWNIGTDAPTSAVTIHHPSGDAKKISKINKTLKTGSYAIVGYVANTHWQIEKWEVGTTETGSSGGPLFDQNHRIVGDLTGGEANCDNSINDFFQKFDVSWNYYAQTNQQLKCWLDPNNTGVSVLNGFDPYEAQNFDLELLSILTPNGAYCKSDMISPKCIVKNSGTSVITNFTIQYQIDNNQTVSQNWTGVLNAGETATISFSPVSFEGGNHTFTATAVLNNFTDNTPGNNSKYVVFSAYSSVPLAKIITTTDFCENSLTGKYTTNINGNYLWSVQNGTLQNSSTKDTIIVLWNSTSSNVVNVNISNNCGNVSQSLQPKSSDHVIKLSLLTDNLGAETSWVLKNMDNRILYGGNNFSSNKQYTSYFCLNSLTCYNFIIYDSNNNGICCNFGDGKYSLTDITTKDLLVKGAEFESFQNTVFCLSTVGINEIKIEAFKVYPNPFSNFIHIKGDSIINQIELFDIIGKKWFVSKVSNKEYTCNLGFVPKGIYFLRVSFESESNKIIKLIKD